MKYFFLIFLFSINLSLLSDITYSDNYSYKIIVSEIEVPWGFVFLEDNSILITERKGELIHFIDGKKIKIKGLPEIIAKNQGGLLDIELHPEYKNNGWIYISYSSSNENKSGSNTSIMRFKIEKNSMIQKEIIYKALPNSKRAIHYGSRIEFDQNNFLYFSIGDRGNRDVNPQNIQRDGGKIYRLYDDGQIPIDNPFIGNSSAKKAIYSYGHRNPQGMVMNPFTKELWTHEHGPRGGDEINIIKKGANYGWPLASFGINYIGTKFTDKTSIPGMENPIHYWVPSIAPSGMAFITSDVYPNSKGDLLIGSLIFQYLHKCKIKNNKIYKEERILEDIGRVRSIRQGPDGYMYIGVENMGIIKLIPN
jgi:glucose/arabinose dehydrogenase